MPSIVVTLDVSKLSGWLNAAADCRVERRTYDAGRGVGREAGGRGPAAARERHARGEGPAVKAGGARAWAERTMNMLPMSVTLDVSKLSGWLNAVAPSPVADPNMKLMSVTPEVSQLDTFALKSSKPEKSPLISGMAETS